MGSLRNLDFEIPNFENFEQSFSLESSSDGQNRSGHFQIIEMVIGILVTKKSALRKIRIAELVYIAQTCLTSLHYNYKTILQCRSFLKQPFLPLIFLDFSN